MDITTRNRTDLKKYFQKGDKPTELQFAEFIEAGLNQADDGIVKPPGDPLSIQVNDKDGVQKLLNFYEDFQDNNPRWALNLNPKEGTQNRPGFNIMDGGGNSRLFIQDGTGNIGIGTTAPVQKLEIGGNLKVDGGIVAPVGTLRDAGGGWIRTYGNTGWYNQTHDGGWYMTDGTWLRSYKGKPIHTSGVIQSDGGLHVGGGGAKFKADANGHVFISGAITSPAGTIRDDNGGWVRTYGNTGWYNQTYDGGWYMTDGTWLRSYKGKPIHTSGVIQSDGGLHIGGGGAKFKADANGHVFLSGAITSPEGTLRDDNGGWVRTYGNTGWFSETHKGGWYMTDANWIRSYNSKDVLVNTKLRADGGLEVGGSGNNFKVASDGNMNVGNFFSRDQYLTFKVAGGNKYRSGIKLWAWKENFGFSIEHDERSTVGVGLHIKRHNVNVNGETIMYFDSGGNSKITGNLGVGQTVGGGLSATLDVARGTGGSGTAIFRGTNNTSHFNYSTGESTHIRGGKPGATVNINDITNPGKTYVGSDFQVAGGKQVWGIPIVDFQTTSVSFTNHIYSARTMPVTMTFSQPVLKASCFLNGWYLSYLGRELVKDIGVSCQLQSISGNSVTFNVVFWMRDASGVYDDFYSGSAIVSVIAQLKNSI